MKPMLFNMPMVQAIQSGTKTVTRRAMKPQPTEHLTCGPNWKELLSAAAAPYHPGDVLWVRETWRKWSGGYSYKADAPDWACQWKPSIHMLREAARLFLRVTDVRVERLQNIQPSGAIPEYVELHDATTRIMAALRGRTPVKQDEEGYTVERLTTKSILGGWTALVPKQEVVNRLAAYEDTGLEPEEIDQICRAAKTMMFETVGDFVRYSIANFEALQEYRALGTVEHLTELIKAESEGWLALLSIPMLPMVKVEGDSDVYCPRCGYDLSGSWNEYHPDQGWTMCQCPNCGQSICDTKTMTRTEAEAALGGGGDGV